MPETLIVQSHRPSVLEGWIGRCVQTVRDWADARGYDYRWLGDELFDHVPDWVRQKVADKLPVASDLARLRVLQQGLDREGYQRVCWIDADVYLFAPELLVLDIDATCGFGREVWIEQRDDKLHVRRNVHNAICVFYQGCPVLPFLGFAVERILERIDGERIAPQVVGPKLLTSLHNTVGFTLYETVGAFSPVVNRDIAAGGGAALDLLLTSSPEPLAGANLCGSLAPGQDLDAVCDRLGTVFSK